MWKENEDWEGNRLDFVTECSRFQRKLEGESRARAWLWVYQQAQDSGREPATLKVSWTPS